MQSSSTPAAGQPKPEGEGGHFSQNQKIALGLGAAAAVAASATALGVGGGYLIYNHHQTSTQNESPTKLHVTIESASNLVAADHGKSSDPYVIIKAGACGAKTKTIKKELNPTWNETFTFGVLPEQMESGHIEFQVNDKDMFHDDDIGVVKVPLSSVSRGSAKKHNLKLEGVDHGQLVVSLHITG